MLSRGFKIVLICFAIYCVAFLALTRVVHISYYRVIVPRPPQFIMYISRDSSTANKAGHILFAHLIWICERTGEFEFEDDSSHIDLDGYHLLPKLWDVFTYRRTHS
jgi:hypothetical protein